MFGDRQFAQLGLRVVGKGQRSHVFRVIGHCLEVKRTLQLNHVTAGVLDRLAERELIRFFRAGVHRPEHERIELRARAERAFRRKRRLATGSFAHMR